MRLLLVEGADDQHVLWALLERRGVAETFKIEQAGGFDPLLQRLPVDLKSSGLERIGVIVDADQDASARWRAVRSVFRKAGFGDFPAEPEHNGLVFEQKDVRVGAWLMPDNDLPGMLEDFVGYLVPDADVIWPESEGFVDGLADSANRYKDVHSAKARIHAWLAVQDSPGSPMGQAITRRMLRHDGPQCDNLIDWLNRLFG